MFEDALLESGGRIRTHRGWFSGVAAACNSSLLCLLLIWPLLHPASLPSRTISMLIAAPAPPAPPSPPVRSAVAANRATAPVNPFTAPQVIPKQMPRGDTSPPALLSPGMSIPGSADGAFSGLPGSIGVAVPPPVRVASPQKLAISSGVMEGRRLGGTDPRYPAIAAAAGVQGTVVLAATITKTGAIDNLRVVSGPPMLIAAAEDAVKTWRYRPYLLNGEPVAVETTVRVVFRLSS